MEKETTQHPLGWTSLEDFIKLYEAGLNPETADMYYPKVDDNIYSNIPYPLHGKAFKPHASDMLCWSLGKLESMLPDTIGDYEIDYRKYSLDGEHYYQIAYGSRNGSSGEWHDMINTPECGTLIEAVVSMTVLFHTSLQKMTLFTEEQEKVGPETIEEAMDKLDSMLSIDDKDSIKTNSSYAFHHTLGRYIRNEWGFWNDELNKLKSLLIKEGFRHPDGMSDFIIKEYKKHLDRLCHISINK